jgi:hypothetical protein
MRNHAPAFELTIWPTVRPIPCPPKNDDQDRDQDHQQVVKIEFKRRIKPLKMNELADQDNPLLIGNFLGRETRYEHDGASNHVQYVEKHLEPP